MLMTQQSKGSSRKEDSHPLPLRPDLKAEGKEKAKEKARAERVRVRVRGRQQEVTSVSLSSQFEITTLFAPCEIAKRRRQRSREESRQIRFTKDFATRDDTSTKTISRSQSKWRAQSTSMSRVHEEWLVSKREKMS